MELPVGGTVIRSRASWIQRDTQFAAYMIGAPDERRSVVATHLLRKLTPRGGAPGVGGYIPSSSWWKRRSGPSDRAGVTAEECSRRHTPSLSTWELAATLDVALRAVGPYPGSLGQRSSGNDLLLAATVRELGATLMTENTTDFELIGRVVPLKVAKAWPLTAT